MVFEKKIKMRTVYDNNDANGRQRTYFEQKSSLELLDKRIYKKHCADLGKILNVHVYMNKLNKLDNTRLQMTWLFIDKSSPVEKKTYWFEINSVDNTNSKNCIRINDSERNMSLRRTHLSKLMSHDTRGKYHFDNERSSEFTSRKQYQFFINE